MKPMYWAILICLLIVILLSIFRLLSRNEDEYHADPYQFELPKSPNAYISADVEGKFDVSAKELMTAMIALAQSEPRTKKLDVGDSLHVTFVSRSLVMGYPDYISVKVRETSDRSSEIKILSRSRFGYSDFGVNRARVQRWLSALRQDLGT